MADTHLKDNPKSGLVILSKITLTVRRRCAAVPVAAAMSLKFDWTADPVFASSQVYLNP